MARLPVVTREMVPAEFVEAFDELTAATGGTITGGPTSITVNSPELARRRGRVSGYLRFESTFPKRIPGTDNPGHRPGHGLSIHLERPRP